MAKNYVEDGKTMDWTNGTTADVASGDLVAVGEVCGVAADDIAVGADGVLFMFGVFEVSKDKTVALSQGDKCYLGSAGVTSDAGTDTANPLAGTLWADAATADTTCVVRLGV